MPKKHGVGLDVANHFEWGTAMYRHDHRKDYGEHRIIATGIMNERLHVMVFVVREAQYRIISIRKANSRERKKYEK